MKRMNKESWFTAAMPILAEEGFGKITVDHLCRHLNKTKGSFYHHFKNVEDFILALMLFWLEQNTLAHIEAAEQYEEGSRKKQSIDQFSLTVSFKAEANIRAWGYSHPTVKEYVQKSDQTRVEYLIKIRQQSGDSREKAVSFAMLEYAVMVGTQQLFPTLNEKELNHLYMQFSQAIQ